ncbi:MAG: hypothetical protein HDR04_05795 [Lachnospiraceae bacterium]|nr:hypothetical protein [Lachnospiraceae bacterium]
MEKFDVKKVKSILEIYDQQGEFVFPEEMELDEKQKEFLSGYLCAQMYEAAELEEGKEEEIRQQILQVRSKYCEEILKLLFNEGELYHGDLAQKMKLSPSGLNSIIKKMQEGDTPIINMMQIGKYKIYTLPDEVRKYMEKKAHPKQRQVVDSPKNSRNLLLCLQRFVEKADYNWKEIMNRLLLGDEEEISDDIRNCFRDLMTQVQWAEENDEDSFAEIKKALKNDVLIYLLEEYLDEIRECELIREEILSRKNGKRLLRHFVLQ